MKRIHLAFLATAVAFAAMTGCASGKKKTHIDQGIKDAFAFANDRIDESNLSLALSAKANPLEKQKQSLRIEEEKPVDLSCSIADFLAEEFFGLYIFDCVNYCVQYAYEDNGIAFGDRIYAEVDNELNSYYRSYLKEKHATTAFYFQMVQEQNDLLFYVDWPRETRQNGQTIEGNTQVGCVYADGKIVRGESGAAEELYIACLTMGGAPHIITSHYDFVNRQFELFTIRASVPTFGNQEFVDAFNAGTLDYAQWKEWGFDRTIVATANMAEDYLDADYEGYFADAPISEEFAPAFASKYAETYEKTRGIPLRDDRNAMNHSQVKKVNFLNDSLDYGLAKTKILIDDENIPHLCYIPKETFIGMIDDFLKTDLEEDVASGMRTLRNKLSAIKDKDYRTTFDDGSLSLKTSSSTYYWHNAYRCEEYALSLTDSKTGRAVCFHENGVAIIDAESIVYHHYHTNGQSIGHDPASAEDIRSDFHYEEVGDGVFDEISYFETLVTCDRCGELFPIYRSESIYRGSFVEPENEEDNGFRGVLRQNSEYEYDFQTARLALVNRTDYLFEQDEENDVLFLKAAETYAGVNGVARYCTGYRFSYEFAQEGDVTTLRGQAMETFEANGELKTYLCSDSEVEVTRLPNGYIIGGESRSYLQDGTLDWRTQARLHSEFTVHEETGWTMLSLLEYERSSQGQDWAESVNLGYRYVYGNLEDYPEYIYDEETGELIDTIYHTRVYVEEYVDGADNPNIGYIEEAIQDRYLVDVLSFLQLNTSVGDGYFAGMIRKAATGSMW